MSDVQWEVRWISAARPGQTEIPRGWEPFAGTECGIWIRRRVITDDVNPLPRGILTAEEQAARRQELENRQSKEFVR